MRAVSTVLDATVFLLLVTASASTLTGTFPATPTDRIAAESADETVETLATSTARVSYAVGDQDRTAHDTLAGLLASAARADAGAVSPDARSAAFVRAVTDEVNRTLGRVGVGVQVWTRWSSSGSAPTDGRLAAGRTPPSDADVHAAELVVRQVRLTVRTWSK